MQEDAGRYSSFLGKGEYELVVGDRGEGGRESIFFGEVVEVSLVVHAAEVSDFAREFFSAAHIGLAVHPVPTVGGGGEDKGKEEDEGGEEGGEGRRGKEREGGGEGRGEGEGEGEGGGEGGGGGGGEGEGGGGKEGMKRKI